MTLLLGLDIGTQGAKAVVYSNTTKKVVSRGAAAYNVLPSRVAGRAEQHPSTWIQGAKQAISEALRSVQAVDIVAIAVSGQQHGLVALDKEGKVLRPAKLWCDTESAVEAKELSQRFNFTMVPSFTVTKLLWLQRNEPEAYAAMAHMLLPHDYMNYYLTGVIATEAGDASGSGVFDSAARCWDQQRIAAVDPSLAGKLPPLLAPNQVLGCVTAAAAQEFGLPEGVLVGPGSGDNAMSALGAGVVSDGQLVVSLGTSGTLFGKSPTPLLDPSGVVCPFCDATGAWLPLLCTLNCTKVVEEVREAFGMSHAQLTELASKEPPGCDGVALLPYLVGERTPNWPHATGALLGLRPGCLRPGLLYRAALEGATLTLLAGLRRMQAMGLEAKELRLVGGGSKNPLWRQIVADAFQLPIRLPLEPESAALGAALQAGAVHANVSVEEYVLQHPPPLSEEVIVPNPANKLVYEEALRRLEDYGTKLFD